MRGVIFFLVFACAQACAAVLLDEDLVTLHILASVASGEAKRCADMTPSAIESPQTSLARLRANHAPLLEKGRQVVSSWTPEQQKMAVQMAQVMGEQLKQMSSGTAERQVAACAEMSRWLAHRASASETAMAHEEMNSEVERFFPGRPDACHALARSVENAAREFLASLQTVRPREPDLTKTLRSLDDTTQAAPRCEGLRQRAVRRQIDFPDGFNEMSALATAISQASVLNFITEEENRAKELATAYLARIRAK